MWLEVEFCGALVLALFSCFWSRLFTEMLSLEMLSLEMVSLEMLSLVILSPAALPRGLTKDAVSLISVSSVFRKTS